MNVANRHWIAIADNKNITSTSTIVRTFETSSKQDNDNILEQKDPENTKKTLDKFFHRIFKGEKPSRDECNLGRSTPQNSCNFYIEVMKKRMIPVLILKMICTRILQ